MKLEVNCGFCDWTVRTETEDIWALGFCDWNWKKLGI